MKLKNLLIPLLVLTTIAISVIGISLYLQPGQSTLGLAIIVGAGILGAASFISGLNDMYDLIGKLKVGNVEHSVPTIDKSSDKDQTVVSQYPETSQLPENTRKQATLAQTKSSKLVQVPETEISWSELPKDVQEQLLNMNKGSHKKQLSMPVEISDEERVILERVKKHLRS